MPKQVFGKWKTYPIRQLFGLLCIKQLICLFFSHQLNVLASWMLIVSKKAVSLYLSLLPPITFFFFKRLHSDEILTTNAQINTHMPALATHPIFFLRFLCIPGAYIFLQSLLASRSRFHRILNLTSVSVPFFLLCNSDLFFDSLKKQNTTRQIFSQKIPLSVADFTESLMRLMQFI